MMIEGGRRETPAHLLKYDKMRKRIRFLKDVIYPNGRVDKKGVERYATRRHAQLLIENKEAEMIGEETEQIEPEFEPEVKEEKQVRQTKEEKTTRKRRTK